MGTYQSKYTGAEIDTLLDTVNASGGSGKSKVEIGDLAYTNSTTDEAASTATLTDNIENYDFLTVDVSAITTANDPRTLSPIIIHVPSLVAQGYYSSTNKNLFHGMSGFLSGSTQHSVRVTLGFESGTYLSLVSAIPSTYQTAKLGKVYGIKLR